MSSPGLGTKVARGAGLIMLLRLAERLVGIVSFSILARLLVPEDFGLFALAISIVSMIELFGQAGLDLALIQRRGAGREEYDTAWTFNIIVGTGVAAVAGVSAVVATVFVADSRVPEVLFWLAAASLIGGFTNVGVVDFQKHMAFGREFRFRLFVRLIQTGLTVSLALAWRDYWALVAGYLGGTIARVVLSYLMHTYRPRPSLSAARSFFRFSGWVLLRNIFAGAGERATNLLLGAIAGPVALGLFTAARTVADMATTEIQAPIRRALFPSISRLNGDLGAVRRHYADAVGMTALICVPVPAGLILVAEDVVRILLGEPWLSVVPLIQILALAGIFRSFFSGAQFLLIALGKPEQSARLAAIRLAVLLPLVALGAAAAQGTGAAWAMVALAGCMLVVNLPAMLRAVEMKAGDFAARIYRPGIAAATMVLCVWYLGTIWAAPVTVAAAIGHLTLVSLAGSAVYAATVLVLWQLAGRPEGAERHVLDFAARKLRRGHLTAKRVEQGSR